MTKRGSSCSAFAAMAVLALLAADAGGSMAMDNEDNTIRLPSDGIEAQGLGLGAAAAAEEEEEVMPIMKPPPMPERPWDCCNVTVCTKSSPPTCRCLDVVDRCAAACDRCEAAEVDPSRRVCKDQYFGDPGPTCKSKHSPSTPPPMPERPWDCCNVTVCTKSFPPTCRCLDVVDRCAAACDRCEPAEADPSRRVCKDQYFGDPGPTCKSKHDGGDDGPPTGGGSPSTPMLAAATGLLLAFSTIFVFTQT